MRTLLAMASVVAAACVGRVPTHQPNGHEPRVGGATVSVWLTTPDRTRLLSKEGDLHFRSGALDPSLSTIVVDTGRTFQSVHGWGAALTDASAYLIQTKLDPSRREALLQELFGAAPGLGFSFLRVTIGASDFSRTHYSYDDMLPGESDPSLARFSIDVDRAEKLPVLRRAMAINPRLKIVGTPWSPPGWMKTSRSLVKGTLLPQHYPAFARYLHKWTEAYAAEGLPIFAITLQNEPHFEPDGYPGMRLDPAQRATLIREHVGPLFERSGSATRILEWDHNWDDVQAPLGVLGDSAARRFVAGVAWHCYAGDISAQQLVHDRHPDKETYFTECSGGAWAPVWGDNLKWNVSMMVIRNARTWARGVALWNLALDERHGPHLGGCGDCRGVVTIDASTGDVVRNEEYYALGHASRFVRPGGVRVRSTEAGGLETVAFRNADDGSRVLLVLNGGSVRRAFAVHEGHSAFSYALPAGAVATFVWK